MFPSTLFTHIDYRLLNKVTQLLNFVKFFFKLHNFKQNLVKRQQYPASVVPSLPGVTCSLHFYEYGRP